MITLSNVLFPEQEVSDLKAEQTEPKEYMSWIEARRTIEQVITEVIDAERDCVGGGAAESRIKKIQESWVRILQG